MICNLFGVGDPGANLADPCVCNAPIGSIYIDTVTLGIWIRLTFTTPCDAGDWYDLCATCAAAAFPDYATPWRRHGQIAAPVISNAVGHAESITHLGTVSIGVAQRVGLNLTSLEVQGNVNFGNLSLNLNQASGTAFNSILGGQQNVIGSSTTRSSIAAGSQNSITFAANSFIGGGGLNSLVFAPLSLIGAGTGNRITQGSESVILSGTSNIIDVLAAIPASISFSAIIAGQANIIRGLSHMSAIIGGQGNIIEGSQASAIVTGSANIIRAGCTYSAILTGISNEIFASADKNVIISGTLNTIESGALNIAGGGTNNRIRKATSAVLLGGQNSIIGPSSVDHFAAVRSAIIGGEMNAVYAPNSFIIGGFFNAISCVESILDPGYTTALGILASTESNITEIAIKRSVIMASDESNIIGDSTAAPSDATSIIASINSDILSPVSHSVIIASEDSILSTANGSIIVGGFRHTLTSAGSAIIGGADNTITNPSAPLNIYNILLGGNNNTAQNHLNNGFIIGGTSNILRGTRTGILASLSSTFEATAEGTSGSLILGGLDLHFHQTNEYSMLFGGQSNNITRGYNSTILGGATNNIGTATNFTTSVAILAGTLNTISHGASNSVIVGGASNTIGISAQNSALIGTNNVVATSVNRGFAIGWSNSVLADTTIAMGRLATAINGGTFIWQCDHNVAFNSSATNQFSIKPHGGVRIFTNAAASTGMTMAAGGSSWVAVSAKKSKARFKDIDGESVIDKLDKLTVQAFSYKKDINSNDDDTFDDVNVGTTAEDWLTQFGDIVTPKYISRVVENEKGEFVNDDLLGISEQDQIGILLLSIKQLSKEIKQLKKQIKEKNT